MMTAFCPCAEPPAPVPNATCECISLMITTLRRFSFTPEKSVRHGEAPPLDVYRITPPSPTA